MNKLDVKTHEAVRNLVAVRRVGHHGGRYGESSGNEAVSPVAGTAEREEKKSAKDTGGRNSA